MLQVLQSGTLSETQLSALRLILEFGSSSQKKKAMKEVCRLASSNKEAESNAEPVESCTGSEDNSDESSIAEVNDVNDVNSLSSSD